MSEIPTQQELREIAGISQPYASLILGGHRSPPRSLAIHVFKRTGWRHESISGLTEEQMTMLEQVEPWVAPSERAA